MVISDEEVEEQVAGSTCHCLNDLVRDGWNTRVADGDSVEQLQVMDEAQGTALLFNTEPAGAVGGIRVFIHSCCELLFDEPDDFLEDSWGNWEVLVHPQNVLNHWDFNRCKVLILEPAFLCLRPGKHEFVGFEDVVHKLEFLGPEKVVGIEGKCVKAFFGEAFTRREVRQVRWL